MTKFNPIKLLDQIIFVNVLQIWNLRYSRYFWIIKCVSFEPIFFAINLDTTPSSKVFSTFDFVFLYIIYITNLNQ